MGFVSQDSGIAASIFLGLYVIYILFAIRVVYQRGLKTTYTSLLVYGILRTAGQLCGVAFSALGYEHYQWLIAYLVFSAEGYLVLILSGFHFIANAQVASFGRSWIRPEKEEKERNMAGASNPFDYLRSRYTIDKIFHLSLIAATAFVISGGTMLAGDDPTELTTSNITTSKGLRTAGQIIFLVMTIFVIYLANYAYFVEGVRHCNIYTVLMVSPFILIRGIFGVLSIYIQKMNYFDMSNYTSSGLSSQFVTYEYVLATTMEFTAACIYISTHYIETRSQQKIAHIEEQNDVETESSEK
ncbi:uncharacterized protein J8A68_002402 [[Candida] subhashii]|uniref:Uncharacterized protein n=1 Tax=[Candida] subhashii TaxID=561895 RepID=A0A8J5QL13_9ASCO|nr:uncharacterized protein J8A68_002402 [[Candida] subhashii]KAG7664078.1 hypothetical protein J8A68_002402 [[Candida] subhashii]